MGQHHLQIPLLKILKWLFYSIIFSIYTIDLEQSDQSIVIKTQRIIIPDYYYAFNPSIIRWKNSILMSFRTIPDAMHPFHSHIGLVVLDDHFKPISQPQILYVRDINSTVPSRMEDARLISIKGQLYIIYSDNEYQQINKGGFRVYVAQLYYDGSYFLAKDIECLSSFEDNSNKRREKNWVPFIYNDTLLLAYSLNPHKIFFPLLNQKGECKTMCESNQMVDWNWGHLRGGTPALLHNDHYLGFFHSSKKMATKHSQGKEITHYFIGAYLFEKELPFRITHISNKPIIGKDFYNGIAYQPYWNPVCVVFPCGFIYDEKYIWLSYGRQDHEIWVAQIDQQKLYESLVITKLKLNSIIFH